MNEILLETKGLKAHFPVRKGIFKRIYAVVKAVDGVDIVIREGETLALVGESGCGKTTVGKCLLRLIEPSSGTIRYRGFEDILRCSGAEMKRLRREMQIIFQDPYGSMDPRMSVLGIVGEGPRSFRMAKDKKALRSAVAEALEAVQMPESTMDRYIHEFSGGQRQRICIARALAVKPSFIVLDEAVSSLDVSIRAQILNLLAGLQRRMGLTYCLITHDLSVVQYVADRVAVMYLGQIVEEGPCDAFFQGPGHPYTQALLDAVLSLDPEHRKGVAALPGHVPSPLHPPTGCRFHPRCPQAMPICSLEEPAVRPSQNGTLAKCFLL